MENSNFTTQELLVIGASLDAFIEHARNKRYPLGEISAIEKLRIKIANEIKQQESL